MALKLKSCQKVQKSSTRAFIGIQGKVNKANNGSYSSVKTADEFDDYSDLG
jgi:hypothetical protein